MFHSDFSMTTGVDIGLGRSRIIVDWVRLGGVRHKWECGGEVCVHNHVTKDMKKRTSRMGGKSRGICEL